MDAQLARLPRQAFAKRGVLVVTPQGAGKTTFCKNNPLWTDVDKVLLAAGLMRREEHSSESTLKRYEKYSEEMKAKGLRVLSSVWWDLTAADAVVLPPLDVLIERLRAKTGEEAVADPAGEAKRQSKLLRTRARELGLPEYESVEGAAVAVDWVSAVILAAPGSGKSTWAKKHKEWHDMDVLYKSLHTADWHDRPHTSNEEEAEHYRKIDRAVNRDRAHLKIIGSLFWDLVPDAVVLVPASEHWRRVQQRPDLSWERAHAVAQHLRQLARKHGVPVFDSFDEAAEYLSCDCEK